VMQELGYSEAEIQQLAADNIIGLAPGGE
jgi:hypothetical protein